MRADIVPGAVFPDYELLSNLTTTALSAVAREAIEAHRDENGWAMAHPVGTGAFRLKDWRRGQRIVLEANPGYRDERYPAPVEAAAQQLIEQVDVDVAELSPQVVARLRHEWIEKVKRPLHLRLMASQSH